MTLSRRTATILFFILIVYIFAIKVSALTQLFYTGDEIDDVSYSAQLFDPSSYYAVAPEPENGRLSHLISLPLTCLFAENSLIPTRILFVVIHALFLFVFFKTLCLKFSKPQALYAVILMGTSNYLLSFSLFTMTTSNNLFLLFSILAIYYYFRFFETRNAQSNRRFIILAILLAGAIASRLAGILLLAGIIIHDLTLRYKTPKSSCGPLSPYTDSFNRGHGFFTLAIILLNFIPIPFLKCTGLFLAAGIYSIRLISYLALPRQTTNELFTINRSGWLFISHVAFNFALILSPIYLNFRNIAAIFSWTKDWGINSDVLLQASHFDVFKLIGFKFGWVAASLLAFSIGILACQKKILEFIKQTRLFTIIFIINLAFIMSFQFMVAWYPIQIFYFLYIPISALAAIALEQKNKAATTVLLCLCLILPIHEQFRFFRLYPYGHIDGYQYGKDYIGWNRPGFITFEGVPGVYRFFASLEQSRQEPANIICNLTRSRLYNEWAAWVLNSYLDSKGITKFTFISEPFKRESSKGDYFLTSIYTDTADLKKIQNAFIKEHPILIKDLEVATIWKKIK